MQYVCLRLYIISVPWRERKFKINWLHNKCINVKSTCLFVKHLNQKVGVLTPPSWFIDSLLSGACKFHVHVFEVAGQQMLTQAAPLSTGSSPPLKRWHTSNSHLQSSQMELIYPPSRTSGRGQRSDTVPENGSCCKNKRAGCENSIQRQLMSKT